MCKIEKIVHVKRDAFDAYVGRPMPGVDPQFSRFGNPFRLATEAERGSTLGNYVLYLLANWHVVEDARRTLGFAKTIACWCAPAGGLAVDDALVCHAQVLARACRGDYDDAHAGGLGRS